MTTAYSERIELDAATGEFDLEDRHALRRVAGLSTELTDITEVEYRALRLERVVQFWKRLHAVSVYDFPVPIPQSSPASAPCFFAWLAR